VLSVRPPALPGSLLRAKLCRRREVDTQGHIRKRAPAGSWEYILDVGRYRAQRCQGCGKRFWVERRPQAVCPACGGELRETEERRRETKGGFASRKDCQAALTRKLTTLAEHTYVLPSRLSLREFLVKVWLPAIASGVRETTLGGYRMLVEQHLVPQLGAVQLQNLNAAQINAHYARLLREGRVHGSGGLSPNTVHHVHAVLHRALHDAVRWGYLQNNVAQAADPPRASAQHTELAVWSEEQLHAFLDSVEDQRLYPLWRFLAMTGCRRGEALGLTWRDLDIEGGRVAIRRALVPVDGKLVETEPKTRRGRRLIALDAETVAVLRQQAARQLAERQALGDGWIDNGRVFTAESGAQLHPERISALFRRLVAAAALPQIPLHGLRHTYASLALAKGVNAAIVSRRLGHATVAFTLDIYSHVLPQVDAEAAELIAAFAERERSARV
jgi:integrase